jgi:hypothetical protein
MKKPATKADLMPPFRIIGEAGWVEALQKLLVDYGIESSKRVPEEVVEKRERELGIQIPYSLRIFLTEFGNIDFDCFCLYPLSSIKPVTNMWFRDFLALKEKNQLQGLLGIADSGSDNVVAIDPITGHCYICSYAPASIFLEAASFDDLLQKVIIDLSWGYYGWPDAYIEVLANELKRDLFGN